jgi:hypothetical protein
MKAPLDEEIERCLEDGLALGGVIRTYAEESRRNTGTSG